MKKYFFLYLIFLITVISMTNCQNDDTPLCVSKTWYEDSDADGHGNSEVKKIACTQPDGFVSDSTDIDDTCIEMTFYEDADDDGLGNLNSTIESCSLPRGYVSNSNDTDDQFICSDSITNYIPTEESLIFSIVGDLGDNGSVEKGVSTLIKSWNPAFIVTTGDNDYTTDGKEFNGFDNGVGRYFHDYVYNYHGEHGEGSSKWKFFPAIGDHDGNDWETPFSIDNYLDFFSLPNQELPGGFNTTHGRYYQFRWENVHFFILNTWDWNTAEPDGATKNSKQAKWLQEQVCLSDALFKIVISHWPPYGSNKHFHTGDGKHLTDWKWKAMGVDIIFSGNDHGYEKVVLPKGFKSSNINNGGLYGITTAGGGAELYKHKEPFHPGSEVRYSGYGASKITITDRSLIHEFISIDGDVIDSWKISK